MVCNVIKWRDEPPGGGKRPWAIIDLKSYVTPFDTLRQVDKSHVPAAPFCSLAGEIRLWTFSFTSSTAIKIKFWINNFFYVNIINYVYKCWKNDKCIQLVNACWLSVDVLTSVESPLIELIRNETVQLYSYIIVWEKFWKYYCSLMNRDGIRESIFT